MESEPKPPAKALARMSLFGVAVAVAALVRLMTTHSLFGIDPISIGVQVAAALLMVWARLTFGMRSFHAAATPSQGELVTRGPYAFVRNPIYAAVILFTWAGVAVHWDLEDALLGAAVAAGMLIRVFSEEKLLQARYGEAYADYARRVKRLVPWIV